MIFENDEDQARQDRLAWHLEYLGYDVIQTDTLATCDFIVGRRSSLVALMEYKHRHEDRLYDPYVIDTEKVQPIVGMANLLDCKPLLVVSHRLDDGISPYQFVPLHLNYEIGTFERKKDGESRGETPDEVYKIPLSAFRPL